MTAPDTSQEAKTADHGHAAPNTNTKTSLVDTSDALTPDPGTEDMFKVEHNKFAFNPGQLSKLLNPKSLNAFYALGGIDGLEKGLRTDRNAGLSVEESTLDGEVAFHDVAPEGTPRHGTAGDAVPEATTEAAVHIPPPEDPHPTGVFCDRKKVFRDNRLPEKKTKSLLEIAWTTYNDKVLILLTIAAIISLALGLYQTFGGDHKEGEPKVEWVEGVAIIVAIVIVVLVGTINDWHMQRQFTRLTKKTNDRMVNVIRSGKSQEISISDVMVGDVMHLATGDIVPVDGIFIQGSAVKCDESSATGESDLLKKSPAADVFHAIQKLDTKEAEKLDPFIISGSKVNEGNGTFLVTAVGVNSSYGRISMALRTEQEDTPLQKKLNILADWIAKFGAGAALLLFIALFIKFCAHLPNNHGTPSEKGQEFMKIFIVSVTVVVVAVPEGLPLAVTLALSFATVKMLRDNNLVRVLKACETMGNATTVCSDKTGTLTQNKMTVVATTLGKSTSFGGTNAPMDKSLKIDQDAITIPNVSESEFANGLSQQVKEILTQSNVLNSTAFEGEQDGVKTFIGSKTEVALLTFCRDQLGAGPVQEIRASAQVVQTIPFDSKYKYSAIVVKLANGKYRVYAKGASEILLEKCSKTLENVSQGEPTTALLTDADRNMFNLIISSYAGQTLRTIGSSYRDFESWPPEGAVSKENPSQADFNAVHKDMTLIGIYGIKDPLRPTVIDALKDCRRAGVFVRMVTGDNIQTASAIASECGIFRPDEGGIAMEGPDFRRLPPEELKQKVKHLQVLARSSPEDKRILVRTLKELGETVAVTGDGTNDAPALKMADIGFSMGIAGTEVAKEASSIILLDDNFASIVKGLMWGRAVNDSVKKFLQFQLTVNVTAVVLTFVSAVASSKQESVLNAVQLLWVNLIMDTFAALALATDPPTRSVLDRKPDRKSAPLITLRMSKMIIGQAICQLAITFVLNFGGKKLLGWYDDSEHDAKALKTLVFNTFVWLQIFNEINNRRLDNKLNIFEGLHRNIFFIIINIIMVGGQVLIIFVGDQAFEIVRLNGREWGLSIGLGAISLPWGALIRLCPDEWVAACLPGFIHRRWLAPPAEELASEKSLDSDDDDFARPPLRVMSSIRGPRVQQHIGFRERMRRYKEKTQEKAQETKEKTKEVKDKAKGAESEVAEK
ncbi:Calcium-transporting ATPase [Fusarium keratoplasticum]|uniref:Calcium-transporting ATPase n=1 Tax=Fusarium keratoplasticum TaxID=1328300 RepID=A0ACC0RD17_9HYPO|nr:Calcium-transporting ATPase [Fusarium keratoplasticum]KAI8683991.1 Calcium-transporting ATPase [Fusarium keratoplasticum]KAI8688104.1 Calcium-transporting ATPase [Fusarium keratoplasticum]